jgi:hypothetical protein
MTDSDQPEAGLPAEPQPAAWNQPPITEISGADPADPSWGWGQPITPMPAEAYRPAPRRRWPWLVSIGAALLVLVLGGGAFAAYQSFNGGGTQPEKIVPADSFAFAKLDLNPSASQKLAAIRFFSRLPRIGTSFSAKIDPRESFFTALASGGQLPAGFSYNKDVKPWLGDRIAVAARPALVATDSPDVIIAVKSSDQAKAKAGIARLTAEFGSTIGVGFRSGYAILAKSQDIADRALTDDAKGTLADSSKFRADMSKFGDPGIASGWVNGDEARKLAASANPLLSTGALAGLGDQTQGRVAFVVRVTPTAADVVVKSFGGAPATPTPRPPGFPSLGDLPASTAVAVEVAGLGPKIDASWKLAMKSLTGLSGGVDPAQIVKQYEQESGLSLPADLKTLAGADLQFSLDAAGLPDAPRIGVRSATDPAAAIRVLDKLKAALAAKGEPFPITYKPTPNGVVVANDPGYAAELSATASSKLSTQSDFKAALPDAGNGALNAYFDLKVIADELRKAGSNTAELGPLTAFRAVGIQSTVAGGISTINIRVIAG